jgi:hypothetical protein
MSLAPPPVTYTATNDLNILKNIFTPQYRLSNGYYQAVVNTYLPGNVTVGGAPGSPQGGNTGTDFKIFVNGAAVMTLSDLQGWAFYKATSNIDMNTKSIVSLSKLTFVGGNTGSAYTIDATTGTINVSQYWLRGVALTLSGGLPAWANYRASSNILMNGNSIQRAAFLSLSAGGTITNPASNVIGFSNGFGERARITASGSLSIGTTAGYSGYSLNVSGGSILQSPVRVVNELTNLESNSFFIQTVVRNEGGYNVRMGTVGPQTSLILCTGTVDTGVGPFANTDKIQIDGTGNMTLLGTGAVIRTTDTTVLNSIAGVGFRNSSVIDRINFSIVSTTSLSLLGSAQATTYILTSTGFNSLTLPGTTVSLGVYWEIKNATTSNMSITPVGGTIVNFPSSPFTLSANMITKIVYTGGGGSNYYAL